MAYRRSSRRMSRRRRRAPWYKRKYNAMQLASKAAKGVYYLKGLVNSEMLHNQGLSSTTVNTTGAVIPMCSIGQGDTTSGRTGNSILIRNIMLRFAIKQNAAAETTYYRLMLFCDTQQEGDTTPTVTDVLESNNYLSPLSTGQSGRFKVLWSTITSTSNASTTAKVIDKYFKVYNHVRYNGTASTDIQRNGYYFLMLSSESTNTPTIAYSWKIGYHDN